MSWQQHHEQGGECSLQHDYLCKKTIVMCMLLYLGDSAMSLLGLWPGPPAHSLCVMCLMP